VLQPRGQRRAGVAHESDVRRDAEADALGPVVDLHAHGLPRGREELDVRERAADDHQRVAPLDRVLRRPRAHHPYGPGDVRAVVGHAVLAELGLHDRRSQDLGEPLELVTGAASALPGEDQRP
jgi:hypothetical protein